MISEDMELETQIGEARKKHEEILAKALWTRTEGS
jgi:hypothetical protein